MYKYRKEFNVAGPCVPGNHYMLDPLRGIGDELMDLVRQKHYFVIHAARQSGKTTLLFELVDRINAEGDYYALYCTLEMAYGLIEPEKGISTILKSLASTLRDNGMPGDFAANVDYGDATNGLKDSLTAYCKTLDKPLVIFFDEADCLSDGTLISFLRQLRAGYVSRRGAIPFVHSLALVGMRNLRDYKAQIRPDAATLGSMSPFNIVTEAINLRNFTKDEVIELYAQHTAETGQEFERSAVDYAFEQTQGQPWLVNAVARECVEKITKKDYTESVTQCMAEQAVQNIILARGTHVDSLLDKLKEPRVCNVIAPLITGEDFPGKYRSDDYQFTKDLGLIRDDRGYAEPANPIYAELIVRDINGDIQDAIKDMYKEYQIVRYIKDGKIDINYLMKDFQSFWRENSEIIWEEHSEEGLRQYKESSPHMVLQAFLQRVMNGGGRVIREMAIGKKRVDLGLEWHGQRYPIEIKIRQNIRGQAKIIDQLLEYMDKSGSDTGWLVIFDRDKKKSWSKKIYMREEAVGGKRITIVGC